MAGAAGQEVSARLEDSLQNLTETRSQVKPVPRLSLPEQSFQPSDQSARHWVLLYSGPVGPRKRYQVLAIDQAL